ncbi:hypothetical protein AB0M28_18410 [Streptomyces sp. NPDC051940]|uniref:hypothetical protein n=1 Tax=Streptomyces sp. NPDC051940 TaxID=3155675 RepID=UPI00343F6CBA
MLPVITPESGAQIADHPSTASRATEEGEGREGGYERREARPADTPSMAARSVTGGQYAQPT